ncbi:hypothetical protein GCM10010404_81510 [Nonomuraea africana]|uniref:Lipoprotein n=1 Tax=Nonomuraea africana TaxID=46171 RepID=A0ABR9KX59_9ACTN|nr:hypothetical protein [Nonomuraea africana]MBE1566614.1 hypothetical protein [Nonomuraea africana]
MPAYRTGLGRATVLVTTLTAAVLTACASSEAPACAATIPPPPKPATGNSNTMGRTSIGSQPQPAQRQPVAPPARPITAATRPAIPHSKPTTPAQPSSAKTTVPTYRPPAVPRTAVPYQRDPSRTYPTQKPPTHRGTYRHYDGFPGFYPVYVWPVGYADTYGCTLPADATEGQPADLDGDGRPDENAQW